MVAVVAYMYKNGERRCQHRIQSYYPYKYEPDSFVFFVEFFKIDCGGAIVTIGAADGIIVDCVAIETGKNVDVRNDVVDEFGDNGLY